MTNECFFIHIRKIERLVRAGNTVHQGRQCGTSGQALCFIRDGTTLRQGRHYAPSG
jgi:hypothetical protein